MYSANEVEQLRSAFERSVCEYISNFMQVNTYIDSMYIYSAINGHVKRRNPIYYTKYCFRTKQENRHGA